MATAASTVEEVPDAQARIFEAAREVFFRQGYDGGRMEEIARRAGVNKALLHYYYRSKRQLFMTVFRASVLQLVPHVTALLAGDEPLRVKIDRFVNAYVDIALENPHLPSFIFEEIRRNPDWLTSVVRSHTEGLFETLSDQIDTEAEEGLIRRIPAEHLFANILALSAFPFLARPALQAFTRFDDDEYQAFLATRKAEVVAFLKQALLP